MFKYSNKTAVVTGASRGIGKAIATTLANNGMQVIGIATSEKSLDAIRDIKNIIPFCCNISDEKSIEDLYAFVKEHSSNIDILVNNAGILRDKTLYNMEESEWDGIMEVHLKGHYNCTRPFVRYIRDDNRLNCRILNMSSVSGLFGNFGQTNYGAAKAGIAGFTRSLALEVAKYKCTVNTISPGAATRLTIDLIEAAGRKYDENDWTQGPEQIAPVVTWLCSDAADNVTSQIIHSQAGTLGIMQQPAVIKSFTTENLWTIEQLDALMPELLEAKKHHDDEVSEKGAPEKV